MERGATQVSSCHSVLAWGFKKGLNPWLGRIRFSCAMHGLPPAWNSSECLSCASGLHMPAPMVYICQQFMHAVLGFRAGSGSACRSLQPHHLRSRSCKTRGVIFIPAWRRAALPASQGMSACNDTGVSPMPRSPGAAQGQACPGGRAPVEVCEEQEEDDALHQQQQRRQPRPVACTHK